MKTILYTLIITIMLCNNVFSKSNSLDNDLDNAVKMMINRDPKSFNILENICKDTNNEKACLGVGYCYMYGIGTYIEVLKANEIFLKYINSKNQSVSQDAKVCLALLYTNGLVDSEKLDTAISLWKELLNSKNKTIVNMANENLYALNLNIAATNIIQSIIVFGCNKITFEELMNNLNNKQYNNFPKNIFNAYVNWRSAFFNSYKSDSDKIKSILTNIANGVIKGFLRDPTLITDTLKAQENVNNEQILSQKADQLWIDFIGALQNDGVKEIWLNYAQVEAINYCRAK